MSKLLTNVRTRRLSPTIFRWLLALLLGSVGLAAATPIAAVGNPIVLENQQPGTDRWQIGLPGYTRSDDTSNQIRGYASATSINKGQPLTFFVTVNPAQTYSVDVYRIGWYQGLGGRLIQHLGPLTGVVQPAC